MKTNVNIFNNLNESFEKSIKKKITVNEAKTIYTDEKGEDYKELTKAQYLNLGKKYGEKVNNYEVKNLNGKFYILKSDYEDLINESALNESNTDEIATKFGIKENLDKLTNDLMAIDGVSKVEYDLAGLYDNIGFNILVFDDINSDDMAEYYTKRRNMFKEVVKTFEADGVNIEKEETEDNDSYFYFVSYSTNWNMNESSLNEEDLSKDLFGSEADRRTQIKLQNLDIYLEEYEQAVADNDESRIETARYKILNDIGYLIPALNIKGGANGLVEFIKNTNFDFENKFKETVDTLEKFANEYKNMYESALNESNTKDYIYQLVGGEYAGEYTREELEKLPILEPEDSGENPDRREELKYQPLLKGYLGPMWNGTKDGKGVIRYETQEVYNALSENESTNIKKEYQNYCNDLGIDPNKKSSKNRFFNDYAKYINDMVGTDNLEDKIKQAKKELVEEHCNKNLEESEEPYEAAKYKGKEWGIFAKKSRAWVLFGTEKEMKDRAKSLNDKYGNKSINESDEDMTVDEMWDRLLDMGTSEETLQIITSINGYSTETLLDVLYAQYGYRSFDQLEDEEDIDENCKMNEESEDIIQGLIDRIRNNLGISTNDIYKDEDEIKFLYNGKSYRGIPVSTSQIDVYNNDGEKIGYGVVVDNMKEELFTEYTDNDYLYELVGGEYAGTYTREEAEKLPILEPELSPDDSEIRNNGGFTYRKELDNQLQFKGYLGPMWNGTKDGKGIIRYETQKVYDMLSR